jgi:hypothetical protein
MDLASYLNINLKPIVDSANNAKFSDQVDFKDATSNTKS